MSPVESCGWEGKGGKVGVTPDYIGAGCLFSRQEAACRIYIHSVSSDEVRDGNDSGKELHVAERAPYLEASARSLRITI